MKKVLAIALTVVFVLSLAAPPVSAMTHSAEYEWDGSAETFERQVGHYCNTGAEQKVKISGDGEMSRTSDVTMSAGKLTVDEDRSEFVTAEDATENLSVTSSIQLCAPPKAEYTTTHYVPVDPEDEEEAANEEEFRELLGDEDVSVINLADGFLEIQTDGEENDLVEYIGQGVEKQTVYGDIEVSGDWNKLSGFTLVGDLTTSGDNNEVGDVNTESSSPGGNITVTGDGNTFVDVDSEGNVTVEGDVEVTFTNVNISGNLNVSGGATVTVSDSSIDGDVTSSDEGTTVNLSNTVVDGDTEEKDGGKIDQSEFDVVDPGNQVEGVEFDLDITNAQDADGDDLTGDIKVTVTSDTDDGEVFDADVTFTDGDATVEDIVLNEVGDHKLTIDIDEVTEDETVKVTVQEVGILDVTDFEAPSEVEEDTEFTVSADIVNTGDTELTQDVEFRVDGTVEETDEDVTVAGGETESVSFDYTHDTAESIEVEIATDDDSESAEVMVVPEPDPANFEVTAFDAPAEADQGEEIGDDVTATITNTGEETTEQAIEVRFGSDLDEETNYEVLYSTTEELEGAATFHLDLDDSDVVIPAEADTGDQNIGVFTDDDSQEATINISEKPDYASEVTLEGDEELIKHGEKVTGEYSAELDEAIEDVEVTFTLDVFSEGDIDNVAPPTNNDDIADLLGDGLIIETDENGEADLKITFEKGVEESGDLTAAISEEDNMVEEDDEDTLGIEVDTRDLSGFDVDDPGDQVEGEAFNLDIKNAKDAGGDALTGDVNVTVESNVEDDGSSQEVFGAEIEFTDGEAEVEDITLSYVGDHDLTVDVADVTDDVVLEDVTVEGVASGEVTITTDPVTDHTISINVEVSDLENVEGDNVYVKLNNERKEDELDTAEGKEEEEITLNAGELRFEDTVTATIYEGGEDGDSPDNKLDSDEATVEAAVEVNPYVVTEDEDFDQQFTLDLADAEFDGLEIEDINLGDDFAELEVNTVNEETDTQATVDISGELSHDEGDGSIEVEKSGLNIEDARSAYVGVLEAHTVTFDEENDVDAEIQVYDNADREEGNEVGDSVSIDNGDVDKDLGDGNYWFTATHEDHKDYEGSFEVDGEIKTVDFEMVTVEPKGHVEIQGPVFDEHDEVYINVSFANTDGNNALLVTSVDGEGSVVEDDEKIKITEKTTQKVNMKDLQGGDKITTILYDGGADGEIKEDKLDEDTYFTRHLEHNMVTFEVTEGDDPVPGTIINITQNDDDIDGGGTGVDGKIDFDLEDGEYEYEAIHIDDEEDEVKEKPGSFTVEGEDKTIELEFEEFETADEYGYVTEAGELESALKNEDITDIVLGDDIGNDEFTAEVDNQEIHGRGHTLEADLTVEAENVSIYDLIIEGELDLQGDVILGGQFVETEELKVGDVALTITYDAYLNITENIVDADNDVSVELYDQLADLVMAPHAEIIFNGNEIIDTERVADHFHMRLLDMVVDPPTLEVEDDNLVATHRYVDFNIGENLKVDAGIRVENDEDLDLHTPPGLVITEDTLGTYTFDDEHEENGVYNFWLSEFDDAERHPLAGHTGRETVYTFDAGAQLDKEEDLTVYMRSYALDNDHPIIIYTHGPIDVTIDEDGDIEEQGQ